MNKSESEKYLTGVLCRTIERLELTWEELEQVAKTINEIEIARHRIKPVPKDFVEVKLFNE